MVKRSLLRSVTAVLALSVATGGAAAQSDQWNSLYDRIIRLEAEVRGGQGGGGGNPQVMQLQDQIHQLSGQVNALGNEIRRLQMELEQMRSAGRQGSRQPVYAPAPLAPDPSRQATGSLVPPIDIDEPDIRIETDLAPGPRVLGQIEIEQFADTATYGEPLPPAGGDDSLVPERVDSAALDGSVPGGAGSGGGTVAEELFESSRQKLLGRQLGDAEAGFRTFLQRYGQHELAGEAQYWLGETYYARENYKEAARVFLQGYQSHPDDRKAPDSLLKLGLSLGALGQKQQACGAYAEVARKYPRSGKVRDQAMREMQRAGC